MIVRGANKRPFDVPVSGELVATWKASLGGTGWLEKLVENGSAIDLGGNGYPLRYAITVGALLSALKYGTPGAEGSAVIGDEYYLPKNWTGANRIKLEALQAAPPVEILLVEAWDQS